MYKYVHNYIFACSACPLLFKEMSFTNHIASSRCINSSLGILKSCTPFTDLSL